MRGEDLFNFDNQVFYMDPYPEGVVSGGYSWSDPITDPQLKSTAMFFLKKFRLCSFNLFYLSRFEILYSGER